MADQIFKQSPQQSGSQRRRQEEEEQNSAWQPPSAVNEQSAKVSGEADKTVGNIDDVLNQSTSSADRHHDVFKDRNEAFKDYSSAERNPKPFSLDSSLSSQEKNPTRNAPIAMDSSLSNKEGATDAGKSKGKGLFGTRKRKIGIAFAGGGLASIIIAAILGGGILFKGPLLNGFIKKAFGEGVEYMVESRLHAYAAAFMARDLFEGARRCGTTVDLTCIDKNNSKAPTGFLGTYITAMRNRKLNQELVNRGISISKVQSEKGVSVFRIKTPSGSTDVADTPGAIQQFQEQEIRNPRAATRAVRSIANTHFDGFLARLVVKSVLRRHYGLPLCVLFCNKPDNDKMRFSGEFHERRMKYYNAKTATIGRRMIDQSSARQAIMLKCMLGPCDIREELRNIDSLEAKRLLNDPNKLDELERDGRRMNELSRRGGLTRLAMHRILAKLAGESAARTTTAFAEKTIGPVGLAMLGVMITFGVGELIDWRHDYSGDHNAQKIWNQAKIAFDRGAYNQISTGSDEMFGAQYPEKTYDLAAVASTNERLNGIEKAPAYPYMFGTLTDAQTTQKGITECTGNGEQPAEPEDGEIYCMNDRLGVEPPWRRKIIETGEDLGPFKLVTDLMPGSIYIYSLIFGKYQAKILTNIEEFVIDVIFNNAAGQAALGVLKDVVKFITNLPGIKQVVDTAGDKLYDALAKLFDELFPMPAGDPSEVNGAVLTTAAMIGADVTYNEFAKGGKDNEGKPYGLGAPAVSRKEANTILAQVRQQKLDERKYASIKERFFSPTDPDSLFARILMNEHTASAFSTPQSIAITSFNPFSMLFGSVSSLLTPRTSAAKPIMRTGATGMTQYLYPTTSDILTGPPLTAEDCDQKIEEGFKDSGKIDNLGQTIYDVTADAQKCMLDREALKVMISESDTKQQL